MEQPVSAPLLETKNARDLNPWAVFLGSEGF